MKNQSKLAMTTKTITYCALLAAISIVLARLLSFAPAGNTRWSLDKFPLFLAGVFFGPLAGGLTGFVADATGSMLQYGFNPILCPPAVMYGVFGGIFRFFLTHKPFIPRLIISYLVPTVFGAILYQSAALAWVFSPTTFLEAFLVNLGSRSVQFAVVATLEILLISILLKTGVFKRIGLWPPQRKLKGKGN